MPKQPLTRRLSGRPWSGSNPMAAKRSMTRTSVTGPVIRRGDVWWVTFAGAIGGEIRKTRPAIVVSNNRSNDLLNRVQVVPMTSKIRRVYPGEVLVVSEGKSRKALANQIKTVD